MTVYLEVHDKNPPAGGLDVYAPFIAKFNPTHRDLSELLVPWFGDVPYDSDKTADTIPDYAINHNFTFAGIAIKNLPDYLLDI